MSHGAYMNSACHVYEWGLSRVWISHVIHRCWESGYVEVHWLLWALATRGMICAFTYIYIYMSSHIHLYIYMYKYTYTCIYMYIYVLMYMCIYVYICIYVWLWYSDYYGRWQHVLGSVRSHIYMYRYMYVYTCIYVYICTHVYVYMYICMIMVLWLL